MIYMETINTRTGHVAQSLLSLASISSSAWASITDLRLKNKRQKRNRKRKVKRWNQRKLFKLLSLQNWKAQQKDPKRRNSKAKIREKQKLWTKDTWKILLNHVLLLVLTMDSGHLCRSQTSCSLMEVLFLPLHPLTVTLFRGKGHLQKVTEENSFYLKSYVLRYVYILFTLLL